VKMWEDVVKRYGGVVVGLGSWGLLGFPITVFAFFFSNSFAFCLADFVVGASRFSCVSFSRDGISFVVTL